MIHDEADKYDYGHVCFQRNIKSKESKWCHIHFGKYKSVKNAYPLGAFFGDIFHVLGQYPTVKGQKKLTE